MFNPLESLGPPGGVLPYIDSTGMCHNYIKLIKSLIQIAIKFSWETYARDMDKYRIRVIILSAFQFRTEYQNQAKSSLEQGQVFGGPVAHPSKFLFSSPPPPPPAWDSY